MKSLDKDQLRFLASFCAIFADKYREGLSAHELKAMVLQTMLALRVHSTRPQAARTCEQYGEIAESLVASLAYEDDDNQGQEFECYSARTKLSIANSALKNKIQRAADRLDDRFSEQIEGILASA